MFGGVEGEGGPGMEQFKCLFESADDETIAKLFAMGAGAREGAPLPSSIIIKPSIIRRAVSSLRQPVSLAMSSEEGGLVPITSRRYSVPKARTTQSCSLAGIAWRNACRLSPGPTVMRAGVGVVVAVLVGVGLGVGVGVGVRAAQETAKARRAELMSKNSLEVIA